MPSVTAPLLRPTTAEDYGWMLDLNNAAAPAVNRLDEAALAALVATADWVRAVETDGRPAGLLVVFGPGTDYASLNYRWFADRFDDFRYVDRIVVDAALRGQGLGVALYAALESYATERTVRLTCEVNAVPPNPASLRFHQANGFREVGRQTTEGGAKQVILMEKPLASSAVNHSKTSRIDRRIEP